ncbi:MAG: YsnF/AvaK domain-containing protein [Acetobacteraceae bacterium]|nr:YsnF/AvaK domain-containing protein [Acetobacteraceae bacterium]MBV8575451.1 YsnF/AvaK domain-containing protein [Acetobacteraceae bacterium]
MPTSTDDQPSTLPLHEEQIEVRRDVRVTGRVTVKTETHVSEEPVEQLLTREHAEIERVVIDRPVETVPEVREEGDAIIIPIVEEMIVVEKRLILKEEVRIRRVRETQQHRETIAVRKQRAVVARTPMDDAAGEESA